MKEFCYNTKNILKADDVCLAVCNVDYDDIDEAIVCVGELLDYLIDVSNEEY